MLDSIYHMTLKLFCKHVFVVETSTFAKFKFTRRCYGRRYVTLLNL